MKNELEIALQLSEKIEGLVLSMRQKVAVTVNLTMVHTYFEIGRMIVEHEQQGSKKAEYGKQVLKNLSERLTESLGKGFSERNLEQMRQFYLVYSIPQTLSAELKHHHFQLSWSHYLVLMRIEDPNERSFYDRHVKADFEKPTIGILLCKKRNQALVELTLPETANIYASEYSLYLPDKQLLQQKLAEWLLEFEED
jgi:DUF1016 N-terminal domain/YhcG PDDEXK nuclease domain